MNDLQTERLIHELELTRAETTANTDALQRHSHLLAQLILATDRLREVIEEKKKRRGWFR